MVEAVLFPVFFCLAGVWFVWEALQWHRYLHTVDGPVDLTPALRRYGNNASSAALFFAVGFMGAAGLWTLERWWVSIPALIGARVLVGFVIGALPIRKPAT
jgi:hypothetical protein